ncbi:hypothetical protein Tco_0770147 [Tanacetum coccineum]|uniref:Uncharacterized protein n=1 Tax=Tanacetum coccineum TaxID=301880 RepID=A0ABQ4ZDY7_9ASTR
MVANQFDLPVFLLAEPSKQPKIGGSISPKNRREHLNKIGGNNFQSRTCLTNPRVINPRLFKLPPYKAPAPAPPAPGVSKSDFDNYVKANDAVMQNMQNQMANITDLLTKFVNSNTASTSGLWVLFQATPCEPKGDVKAITTRNSVSYKGPQISPPPKETEK